MVEREKIVAVSFLTSAEFDQWGGKLRNVYHVDDGIDFDDLLNAIDEADRRRQKDDKPAAEQDLR